MPVPSKHAIFGYVLLLKMLFNVCFYNNFGLHSMLDYTRATQMKSVITINDFLSCTGREVPTKINNSFMFPFK